jgi:hypothetical protein
MFLEGNMANDVTLTSTTDTLEQVQSALGIKPSEQATTAPPAEPVAAAPAPAQPGVVTATVIPPVKGAKAAPAAPPAAPPAPPVEEAPAPVAPVEPEPAAPAAAATTDDDDVDEDADAEVDPAQSAAAAELGRKGGQKRGVMAKRLHKQLEINASLRRRLQELEAGGGRAASPAAEPGIPAATPAANQPPAKVKPAVGDFKTYEEWAEANARYVAEEVAAKAVDEALKAERFRVAQEQQRQQATEAMSAYQKQVIAAQVKYEDWDEVVSNPELTPTKLMSDRLSRNELGAEMVYYLAKNPDICKEIIALGDTAEAAEALGEVRAVVKQQLSAEKKAAEKKPVAAAPAAVAPTLASVAAPAAPASRVTSPVAAAAPAARPAARPVTQAPDPIDPVGTGAVATTKNPGEMTFQEYKQWRKAGGGRG